MKAPVSGKNKGEIILEMSLVVKGKVVKKGIGVYIHPDGYKELCDRFDNVEDLLLVMDKDWEDEQAVTAWD